MGATQNDATGADRRSVVFGASRLMRGSVERTGDLVRLALDGEFDMSVAEDFGAALADIEAAEPRAILVDLQGLTHMDSTGVESLMAAHGRAAGRHLVAVLDGTGPAHRLIRFVGLDAHLLVIRDEAELAERLRTY